MERFLAALVLLLALPAPAFASDRIFSYINEDGIRVYTNAPSRVREAPDPVTTIPEGSRNSAPADRSAARGADLFRPLIEDSAARHNVDPSLVEAIMAVESDFDPFAVSSKDCKGLMQLHPDTAKRFGVDDVFDPAQNIEGGVKYLRYLLDFFDGDLEKVAAAYNSGENAVKRYGGTPPYAETRNYLKKISLRYDLTPDTSQTETAEDRSQQVHRITLPDGSVLYTNTPQRTISR